MVRDLLPVLEGLWTDPEPRLEAEFGVGLEAELEARFAVALAA